MLDPRQIGPLINYIQNQRFQSEMIGVENGDSWNEQPPQLGVTLRGRTPETLLRQMHAWHGHLAKGTGSSNRLFPKSPFDGIELRRGPAESPVFWAMREIRSERGFYREGQDLWHYEVLLFKA